MSGYIDQNFVASTQSNARHWAWTLNNPTPEETLQAMKLFDPDKMKYLVFGREVGEEGTPHLQGFVSFKKKQRFRLVKKQTFDRAHFEVARNPLACIQYCKKDGAYEEFGSYDQDKGRRTDIESFKADVKGGMMSLEEIREHHSALYARSPRFCIEYVGDHWPGKKYEEHVFKPWQHELWTLIRDEPDDRTIIFVVDITGNAGKTWFAHYCSQKLDFCQVLLPGKKQDMAYALRVDSKILFIDAPRSKQGEYIQYDFLEEVKNGFVFSPKYESRIKTLNRLHLVVLMNEMPDMTKLSEDRYHIIKL